MAKRAPTSKRFQRLFQRAAKRAARRIERSGHDEIKIAEMRLRAQLRDLAREYRAREREYVKQFRHEIALLKKQGLVSKDFDARSITPNPALEAARTRFADIIAGKSAARHVKSRSFLDTLRKAGAKIAGGNRVILPKEQYVRGEKIVDRSGQKRGQRKARLRLPVTGQQAWADNLFAGLKQGQYVTFDVAGNPVKFLFSSPKAFLDWINRYTDNNAQLENFIEVYEIEDEQKYRESVKRHENAVENRQRKRETARKRKYRNKKRSSRNNTR